MARSLECLVNQRILGVMYLNDDVWKALHIQSQQQGISISELVRQPVREKIEFRINRGRAGCAAQGPQRSTPQRSLYSPVSQRKTTADIQVLTSVLIDSGILIQVSGHGIGRF
jgi:hypothetical protein